jgi:hypothetical protein
LTARAASNILAPFSEPARRAAADDFREGIREMTSRFPGPPAALLLAAALGQAAPAQDEPSSAIDPELADAVRQAVADVAAPSAGHDGRFFIASADQSLRLNLGGYMQFRYYANFGTDSDAEEFTGGFITQRTRLIVSGHLADPGIDFVLLPFAGPRGEFGVLDAWVRHPIAEGWSLQWGQFKLPFLREWLISERFILPVERSIVSAVDASIYSQGVMLNYQGDDWRLSFSFSDGLRALASEFNGDRVADYAFTGRAEWLAFGNWKMFADASSLGNTESGLMLGAAFHHQGETENFGGVAIDNITQYTADLSFETERLTFLGAFVGRHIERSGDETDDDFGALLQLGYFVTDDVELFVRGAALFPDRNQKTNDHFPSLTAGMAWYIHGHALRFKLDGVWFPNNLADTEMINFGESSAVGLLDNGEDQFVIRSEMQILF